MNVIKCLNGHFFDGDSFAVCPHCGANPEFSGAPAGQGMGVEQKNDKKFMGLFGKKRKQQDDFSSVNQPNGFSETYNQPQTDTGNNTAPANKPSTLDFWNTTPEQPAYVENTPAQPVQYYATPKTYYPEAAMNQQGSLVTPTTDAPPISAEPVQEAAPVVAQPAVEEKTAVVEQSVFPAVAEDTQPQPVPQATEDYSPKPAFPQTEQVSQPVEAPQPEPQAEQIPQVAVEAPQAEQVVEAPQAEESLKDAIKKASANPEGTTMGFFSLGNAVNNSQPSNTPETDPVVGWLVCIKGRHIGESFNILSARNSIGRNATNRIVLSKDNGVSREKHAWIVYEPKQKVFYIQPGESSGLTYHNDENIMVSKVLAPRDKIEVGESAFIFVPLCGQDFSWEDYIK